MESIPAKNFVLSVQTLADCRCVTAPCSGSITLVCDSNIRGLQVSVNLLPVMAVYTGELGLTLPMLPWLPW